MAIVTWAPKSEQPWRTMHVRRCDRCQREFLQVPEDCVCPVCARKGLVGTTWPEGIMLPRLVADRRGEPCLDTNV